MKNSKLFTDAVADAKAIRESALINAKQTIEEAFAPKIQEMFDSRLSEMEDDDYSSNAQSDEGGLDEEFDLSSILAELDEEDPLQEGDGYDEGDDLDEAKGDDEGDDDKDDEPKDDKPKTPSKPKALDASKPKAPDASKPKAPAAPKGPEDEDDLNVSDLSVEDFKSIVKDIIAQEMGDGGVDVGLNSSDDLGAPAGAPKMPGMGGEDSSLEMDDDNQGGFGKPEGGDDEEDLNLEALLNELNGLNEDDSQEEDDLAEVKAELNEAIKTIKIQSAYITETKILNAKLRYLSSLLHEGSLNSTQKVKIVEAFDKAKTENEAKLVYESLKMNLLNIKKPAPIKESLFRTSSSKPAGSSTRSIIDTDNVMARMQKLANIK